MSLVLTALALLVSAPNPHGPHGPRGPYGAVARPRAAVAAAPQATHRASGTVTDGVNGLAGVFVGIIGEDDLVALTQPWERAPILQSTVTDATGAFVFDPVALPHGKKYWVVTGAADRFNQIWSVGLGGMQGLPTLPALADMLTHQPQPLVNNGNESSIDFVLALSNKLADVPVPVGLGVTLLTDVYAATDNSRTTEGTFGNPVILVRTPYDKSGADPSDPTGASLIGSYLAWTSFGYTVVLQNTRGRNGSTGTNDVFRTDAWGGIDAQDGLDTIDWLAAQPWCDGNVGLVGPSALAINGYLAAGAVPNALKACYVWAGTPDVYSMYFDGGAYRQEAMDQWLSSMLGGDAARDAYLNAPNKIVANPARTSFWDGVDLSTRAALVQIPMLHVVGWYDLFRQGGLDAYRYLDTLGATASAAHAGAFGNQRLLIGPWSHLDWFNASQGDVLFPPNAGPTGPSSNDPEHDDTIAFKSEIRFFDRWLRLEPRGFSDGYENEPPVRVYTVGNTDPNGAGNTWRDTTAWPPPELTVENEQFFLVTPGARLVRGVGPWAPYPRRALFAPGRSFTYDPLDPVPTIGGPILYSSGAAPAGPRDQAPLEARDDVLVWTTPPLKAPVELAGVATAHLSFSTDVTDTDFVVRLCDVYPDGRSILVTVGALSARYRNGTSTASDTLSGSPDDEYVIEVPLGDVAALFDTGHSIRVSVTSSDAPRLKPNPNTGATFFTGALTPGNTQVAHTTVWCQPWTTSRSSWIRLPVVQ